MTIFRESTITDEDGKSVTFPEYDFELQFRPDWDGPFEWILEVQFSEEDMELRELPYLRAVAQAVAEKLGGKHEDDRSGEEIIDVDGRAPSSRQRGNRTPRSPSWY